MEREKMTTSPPASQPNMTFTGARTIEFEVQLIDQLPVLVSTKKEKSTPSDGYVTDKRSEDGSDTTKATIEVTSGPTVKSVAVYSGPVSAGVEWGGASKTFKLTPGVEAMDIAFTVVATTLLTDTPDPPPSTDDGWTSATDGETVTWTLDPYFRLQRKSYGLTQRPASS